MGMCNWLVFGLVILLIYWLFKTLYIDVAGSVDKPSTSVLGFVLSGDLDDIPTSDLLVDGNPEEMDILMSDLNSGLLMPSHSPYIYTYLLPIHISD